MKRKRIVLVIAIIFIVLGIAVRAVQYFSGRPLWLDEAMLTTNILSRSIPGLFKPLLYEQQAPIGFLLVEKILVNTFGSDELVLRAFPFAASIMSLVGMALLSFDILSPIFALLALLLFVSSAPLIYYASEVKPYALDMTIGVILTFLAVKIFVTDRTHTKKTVATILVVGVVGLWFSQAVAFILAAIGVVGMIDGLSKQNKRRFYIWFGISAAWLASFFAQGSLTLAASIDRYRSLLSGSYAPFPPITVADFTWYMNTLIDMFRSPVGLGWWTLGLVAAAAGVWYLFRAKRKLFVIIVLPGILALITSIAGYYPFTGRFLLFFAPALILLIAYGLSYIWLHAWRGSSIFFRIVSIVLLGGIILNSGYFGLARLKNPVKFEVITPLLAYYSGHRKTGDTLYLYYASAFAFDYYAPRYRIKPADYVIGIDRTTDLTAYTRDLNKLQGKSRVWILFSHVYDWGPVDEEKYFLTRLDLMGQRIDEKHTDDADLYLYNLSQSP